VLFLQKDRAVVLDEVIYEYSEDVWVETIQGSPFVLKIINHCRLAYVFDVLDAGYSFRKDFHIQKLVDKTSILFILLAKMKNINSRLLDQTV